MNLQNISPLQSFKATFAAKKGLIIPKIYEFQLIAKWLKESKAVEILALGIKIEKRLLPLGESHQMRNFTTGREWCAA